MEKFFWLWKQQRTYLKSCHSSK